MGWFNHQHSSTETYLAVWCFIHFQFIHANIKHFRELAEINNDGFSFRTIFHRHRLGDVHYAYAQQKVFLLAEEQNIRKFACHTYITNQQQHDNSSSLNFKRTSALIRMVWACNFRLEEPPKYWIFLFVWFIRTIPFTHVHPNMCRLNAWWNIDLSWNTRNNEHVQKNCT